MAVNLVEPARGYREGWYTAQVLDDQPDTIQPEKEKLAEANVDADVQDRPNEFLHLLVQWSRLQRT